MEQRINFTDVRKGYLETLLSLGSFIYKSGLEIRLLDLIAYRVSQINGCAYCLDMHHKDAVHHGETEQRLHSLPAWRECPYYSEAERAALQLADSLTLHSDADDATYAALERYFTKEQIADLALAIASTNLWNRLNKTFRTTPGTYQVNQFKATATA
jgi:AhpD family alkylhydroperoxidase